MIQGEYSFILTYLTCLFNNRNAIFTWKEKHYNSMLTVCQLVWKPISQPHLWLRLEALFQCGTVPFYVNIITNQCSTNSENLIAIGCLTYKLFRKSF